MPRARRRCAAPGCDELAQGANCTAHTRPPWQGSDPTRTSTWAWRKLSRAILERDHSICHYCGLPGGDAVDHVVPISMGGTDNPGNLAPIHDRTGDCHKRKTQADRRRAAALRRGADPSPRPAAAPASYC